MLPVEEIRERLPDDVAVNVLADSMVKVPEDVFHTESVTAVMSIFAVALLIVPAALNINPVALVVAVPATLNDVPNFPVPITSSA